MRVDSVNSIAAGDDDDFSFGVTDVEKCVNAMEALPHCDGGSTICNVARGVYREAVTLPSGSKRPRMLRGSEDGVTISGLDELPKMSWQRDQSTGGCIWSATLPANVSTAFSQLFYGGAMMVEARWPNLDIKNVAASALARRSWQTVGNGSIYGRITVPALAAQPFSWTGALATLNVAHQFYTWTRTVKSHAVGSASFEYDKDLPSLANTAAHPNASWTGMRPQVTHQVQSVLLVRKARSLGHSGRMVC